MTCHISLVPTKCTTLSQFWRELNVDSRRNLRAVQRNNSLFTITSSIPKIKDLWRNSRRDKKCEATTADSDRYHLTHREPREDFGDSGLIDFDNLYKFSDSDYSLPPLDHALQLTIFPSWVHKLFYFCPWLLLGFITVKYSRT